MDSQSVEQPRRDLSAETERSSGGDYRSRGTKEDNVTGMIESKTSRLPSTAYLGAAIGAMAVSAVLNLSGKKHWSLFVGQWASPFLLLGVYNKMVKQHGSDAESGRSSRA